MLDVDPDAGEQVVDLADAVHRRTGRLKLLEIRAAGRAEREVPPALTPAERARATPSNGRAITRPTAFSPVITRRAASQAAYSSGSGRRSTWAAIWRTESADVYRIASPVSRWCAP